MDRKWYFVLIQRFETNKCWRSNDCMKMGLQPYGEFKSLLGSPNHSHIDLASHSTTDLAEVDGGDVYG